LTWSAGAPYNEPTARRAREGECGSRVWDHGIGDFTIEGGGERWRFKDYPKQYEALS